MDRIDNSNPRMKQIYDEFMVCKPIEFYFASRAVLGIIPCLIGAHIVLTHLEDPHVKSMPVFDLNLLVKLGAKKELEDLIPDLKIIVDLN